MQMGRVAIGERRREVGCAQLQAAIRAPHPMPLLDDPDRVTHMLDHVSDQRAIGARVLERVLEGVRVVDDVRLRIGRDIQSDSTRRLGVSQPTSSTAPEPLGGQVELVWIRQPGKAVAQHRRNASDNPEVDLPGLRPEALKCRRKRGNSKGGPSPSR
jgi:hypothetical protein